MGSLDAYLVAKPRVSKATQFFNLPVEMMPPGQRSRKPPKKKVGGEKMEKALLKAAVKRLAVQDKMKKESLKKKKAEAKKQAKKESKAKKAKKSTKKLSAKVKRAVASSKSTVKREVKKTVAAVKKTVTATTKPALPTRRVLEATPTAGRRGTGYKWQYVENDKTWRDYLTDASAVVEQHYHEWDPTESGDLIVRAVKSGDWSYDVCFKTMKQTNVDHHSHTKRTIRRVPQNTTPGDAA